MLRLRTKEPAIQGVFFIRSGKKTPVKRKVSTTVGDNNSEGDEAAG